MFRSQIADIDGRLAILQDAEDNYYITAKYLLELANRTYELFKSSEVEEKRQLIKLVLLNMALDGKTVRFQVQKPFNTILNYSESKLMLPSSDVIIKALDGIIEVLCDPIEIEVVKTRIAEIKNLQFLKNPDLV